MFAKRGELALRSLRDEFLLDIAESALAERPPLRANVVRAAERFFHDCGYVNTQWNGTYAVSHDSDGYRYDTRYTNLGPHAIPSRRFVRACTGEFPFFYGAGHP
jgi:hypothetical protein